MEGKEQFDGAGTGFVGGFGMWVFFYLVVRLPSLDLVSGGLVACAAQDILSYLPNSDPLPRPPQLKQI